MTEPLRRLRPVVAARLSSEPTRTVGLALGMVLAAAVWITVGHFVFGTVSSAHALPEELSDLVPIAVFATIGTALGLRWGAEREETLRALQASEVRARDLFEQSGDGILVSDATGQYIAVNAACCRMLGYTRQELLTMRAGDLTAADDPVGHLGMQPRLIAAADEPGVLVERRYRKRDGTSLPVEVRYRSLPDGRVQRNVRDMSERLRAVAALRESEAHLALAARIDRALTEALRQVPAEATLEEAGQVICATLAAIPGIDFVAVQVFVNGTDVIELAHVPAAFPTPLGAALPAHRARDIRGAREPFAQYWRPLPEDGAWGEQVSALGLQALAVGPIVHGDHVDGSVVLGTADASFAPTLVEQMPGLASLGAASSGLFAERMHSRRHASELRARVGEILAICAFHPVFQPIVEIGSGETVGYEALTRFDSGQRPDLCFADAWTVGLGPELEFATLEAALADAQALPAGRWLDLNLSPRLLEDSGRLRLLLRGAGRPIVLEITEHEVIADYHAVREAIGGLGHDIRLAVDDAGAGIANFGHIIELAPDFVKLDISLVRRVNANLGRQALVVAMRHFARTAGCRLIAEGIETIEEARTLAGLGVEFGQGYLFGYPEMVSRLQEQTAVGAPAELPGLEVA
ncbi:MAG: EAL domain-containing protein [Candidatus Limnocylindrales bacterium]